LEYGFRPAAYVRMDCMDVNFPLTSQGGVGFNVNLLFHYYWPVELDFAGRDMLGTVYLVGSAIVGLMVFSWIKAH
jgi:hypothetical protein